MLTPSRLVVRNLAYHWRGNLAVLLGVAVGSAVLTGALLVGDSLRGSLRARAERQLAGVDAAATFPTPVRAPDAPGNDFNLTPSPAAPLNVFVPLAALSNLVQPDPDVKANALLASGTDVAELNAALRARLAPEDYGLRLREVTAFKRKYVSVE